ncbi:hypothetical protein FJT64_018408 [Amphibalanus amphitrite]|uniref:DUF6729 domain-containing protein n=1 Tax=Amphibalanus amphitrite TaxID=1232801 RepID=A0A6A4X8D6_AMPAM|nr:hypothetical protein FJT64_018408 [Amphibalanus amphitrite]
MFLFADQLEYDEPMQEKVQGMAQFLLLFYVVAWLRAPVAEDAPANDLNLYRSGWLCQRVTGRQYASTGESRKRWVQNLTLYRKRQRMVRSSAQLRRDTTIALLDVNQRMLSIWHNREQKSASAADLQQGVCLPDRLHTLAKPAPPARDLPQLPPQPTADRRPKHQLESPADTAGTSFWRANKREEMEAKGFVRPARAFLCKICHEDVKALPTHDRYFGKVYCPSDPEQRLSVRKWREKLRRTILAKDAERSIYAGLDDQRLVADIMGETNLLPGGRRGLFPAVLTHKPACDRAVVVRLRGRTLGNSPTACRNSTAELHDET